jgi:hypothetical protein
MIPQPKSSDTTARQQAPRLAADHRVEFEVAEQCLPHAVGNSVTQAYLRTTMLERRRKVMADLAAFVACESAEAKVVPLKRH